MTYLTIVLAFVVCLSLASKSQVIIPPHIEMNEPEVIIHGDKSFSLKCLGFGVPRPNVTWVKRDGAVLADSNENGTLLFDGFSRRQAGKYQCVASNPYGRVVSNFVELKYAFLGDFLLILYVTPATVVEGASLTLPCRTQIPFSEPEAVFSWVTQDTLDSSNPQQKKVHLDSRVSVDKNGNLRFAHVTEQDHQDGWYYLCEAWTNNINDRKLGSPSRVDVLPRSRPIKRKPKISYATNAAAGTNKVKVIEGDSLDLYCIFEGYPTPIISWSKVGGHPVSYELNSGTRLLVENVKNNNLYNGIYTCIGINSEGRTEQYFDVEVLIKPKFIVGPSMVKNINVTEGSDVEFICDVEAKPPASIKWLVNNIEIKDGGGISTSCIIREQHQASGTTAKAVQNTSEPRRTISGNRFKMTNLQKGNDRLHSDIQVVTCEASNFDEGMEIGTRFSSGYINVVSSGTSVSHSGRTTATLTNATPKEGEDVKLVCVTSPAGSRYALFAHTKAFTEDGSTIKLGTILTLNNIPIVDEDRYSLNARVTRTPQGEAEEYSITIQNLKFEDSGFLGCIYTDTRNDVDEATNAKLLVQVDGDSVEFAEYQNNTDLYQENFRSKNLKLTCIAKGRIPGDQKLFLGTDDITSQATAIVVDTGLEQEGITGGATASWTSILFFDKPFTDDMLGKSISCQYTTAHFPMQKTSVHLQSAGTCRSAD